MGLTITAAAPDPALLDLPWSRLLEEWPADRLVTLPRGISRHVVRFVRLNHEVYAVKEIPQPLAEREFRLLRALERDDEPAVLPVAIVSGRQALDGEPLEAALITRHLQFSLPYRFLFSGTLRPDTSTRLLDALAILLVRLHLIGFFWGDCSLSNVLFRRDAGAFAAYLVDAETAELHPSGLSDGQREYDLDVARTNIVGEFLDLSAGDMLHEAVDPFEMAAEIEGRYRCLWHELYAPEQIAAHDRHLMEARLRRLEELGFDVEELKITTDTGQTSVVFQPIVVEPGHHSRRLLQLTGLDVEENQARRLLADMAAFRVGKDLLDESEEVVAHRWRLEAFQRTVDRIPDELRGKLEPAESYHEILEHRWFLSEAAGRDVGLEAATDSYVNNVLTFKPDEDAVLGADLTSGSSSLAP
ncbi:MAG: DUF4032 domain-containing protein [Acidimicrobiales bacterium]